MTGDEVEAWWRRAEDDLRIARAILDEPDPVAHGAAFHAQQAAEKALKTLLIDEGRKPPRTHNLNQLLNLLRDEEVGVDIEADRHRRAAASLTDHAVRSRYPGPPDVSEEDAREALADAEAILGDAREALDRL